MSSAAVCRFIATTISALSRRAMNPRSSRRMVNQVGSPAMFDGKRFLPLTGMPILKSARISAVFAVWLPDPFTVAMTREKLLMPAALSAIAASAEPLGTALAIISARLSLHCEAASAAASAALVLGTPRRACASAKTVAGRTEHTRALTARKPALSTTHVALLCAPRRKVGRGGEGGLEIRAATSRQRASHDRAGPGL